MNISSNIRKLTILFVVLFMILSGSLVYWQVAVADHVTSNPHNPRTCMAENAPVRGRILDRNGFVLAYSRPKQAGEHGLCGYVRVYTDASLAPLIGYYAPGFYQVPGTIETQYDDYLSGKVGMTLLDNTLNKTLHQPSHGNDIYLTIDDRVQQIVNKDYDTPIVIDNNNTFATDRGAVVVSNPSTGELLAMLSRPAYDPNKMEQTLATGDLTYFNQITSNFTENPLTNRPLQGLYPPGSVYKTVTLMAGLNNASTTLDQQFNQQQALGPITINGEKFGPIGNNLSFTGEVGPNGYTKHFPVTTGYGFAHSDNVIFAQLGVQMGAQAWINFNKQFYVQDKIPFDLPVATSTVLKDNDEKMLDNQLAANAFGQGIDNISPFQMSLFNNTVANNGNLMRPMLISKIVDNGGNTMRSYTPSSLSSPISADTASKVRQAMYGVSFCGSGSITNVLLNGTPYSIISKTGTAEIGIPGKNADGWLISEAPYSVFNPTQLPALTVVAMKENGGEGGSDNGPLTKAIYKDVFTKVDTFKNVQPVAPPANTYCCTAKPQLLQTGPGC